VQPGGREHRDPVGLVRVEQQIDLGAPEDHALGTLPDQPVHDRQVRSARLLPHHAEHELVVDDPVHRLLVVLVRDEDLQAVARQPVPVEVLAHRERGAEQSHPADTGVEDRPRGGVAEVEQRYADRRLDRVGHLVHGVGAQHQEVGAGPLQRRGLGGEQPSGVVPPVLDLHLLDLGEVDRGHQDPGRVQPAEAFLHRLVDEPVVLGGRLPAHAAEEPDALQGGAAHAPMVAPARSVT